MMHLKEGNEITAEKKDKGKAINKRMCANRATAEHEAALTADLAVFPRYNNNRYIYSCTEGGGVKCVQ